MKKLSSLVFTLLVFVLFAVNANAQSMANYTFSSINTGSLDPMTGATSLAGTGSLVTGYNDDYASAVTNIGFTFYFMGVPYTQFSANSNGQMRLGSTTVGGSNITSFSSGVPLLVPIAGDNSTGFSGDADPISYIVTGISPNRILKVQWKNFQIPYNTTGTIAGNIQVWLYETSGKIEYIYGSMYNNSASATTRSIFLASSNTATTAGYITVSATPTFTLATSPVTNSFAAASNIANLYSAADGSRRVYTFTPPVAPTAPLGPMTFSSITATGMTINWTDNSTNETGFLIYRSSDGGANYSYIATTPASATNYNETGLIPGTTYYWKVYAVNEGAASSELSGSQATTSGANYFWVGATGGTWNTASNWNTAPDGTGSQRTTVATTDVLIVDGAGTVAGGSLTISVDLASFSIGQFKVTSNTSLTLQSSATTTRTITLTGGPGNDFVIENGSTLNLTNATNAVAFAFSGTGNTGDISGTYNASGSTSNVITTTGGTNTVVTVNLTGIVNNSIQASSGCLSGSAATLLFSNSSSYTHSSFTTTSALIPTATWGAASNITITGGTTSTGIVGNNQTFGNFTYNSATSTGTMSAFTSGTTTIQGNLVIQATNTGKFRALTSGTLTVNGNLNVSGGNFEAASSTGTLNVLGNVNISGGTFDVAQGGASNLKVTGNFVQTAGNINQTNTAGTLEFNGTSTQTLTLVSGSHGTNAINVKINNSAGVDLTSGFLIRNLTVTKGNLSTSGSGTLTYATTSLLTYNSTTGTQTANSVEFPVTNGPGSLTINNTATSPNNIVSIPFSRTLAGTSGVLTLTAGILDNSTYKLTITNTATGGISGGSSTSFVKGSLERTLPASLSTSATYLFPVGKGTYNPFELVNPTTGSGGTAVINAEVFDADCGGTPGTNMAALNTNRYWAASITSGSGNFTNTNIRLSDAAVISASAIASSSTLAGNYDIVGGTSPTVVVGTSVLSVTPAATTIPGFYAIGTKSVNMAYASSTTTQTVTTPVPQGSTNQQIIGIQIVTTGNANPINATSFTLNTTGCTNAATDIANAKIYYTGTTGTFATTNLFGTQASPNGSYSITGSQALAEGTNYFWLAYDISATATLTNVVDAECTSLIVAGASQTPTITAPTGGTRQILNQSVTGTGVVTGNWPVYRNYNYSTWECIYLQSELGSSKDITKIAFNKSSGTDVAAITPVTIYMKHTSSSTLSTGKYDLTGYTQVYSGSFTNNATSGWMEMTLNSSFSYNGTDNLQVLIIKGNQAWISSYPFYYSTTALTNRARQGYSDSEQPGVVGGTVDLSTSTNVPNMRFDFTLPVAMSYTSSTTTQSVTSIVTPGTNNTQIIGLEIITAGTLSPLSVNNIIFNTTGTTNSADISNAKVFYTGTSSTFSTSTQFGANYSNPNGEFTITGTQTLSKGTNYFWLTYDISPSAASGNYVDASSVTINVGGTDRTPTVTNPGSGRRILAPLSGDYIISATMYNQLTGRNISFEKRTRNAEVKVPIYTETDKGNVVKDEKAEKENIIGYKTEIATEEYYVPVENGKEVKDRLLAPNPNKSVNGFGPQLSGTYASLTAAVTDLNSVGVSGPVRFLLGATQNTETFPITINAFTGASATNTLTIMPNTGTTTTISGSSTSAIFKLNGADYVIIDGSNNGSTSKNMTITNTSTSASTGVFHLVSLGAGAGSTNNTIKNCIINTSTSSAVTYGISIGGSTIGTSGADNDNNSILNNTINTASNSIYAYGTAAVSSGGLDNMTISGNTITSNTSISAKGVQVGYALISTVSQNTIDVQQSLGTGTPVGISFETGVSNSTISRNLIKRCAFTSSGGYGGRGITVGTGSASSNVTVSNNMIYGVTGDNFSSFANSSSIGIAIGIIGNSSTLTTVTGGVNIYYNSVNMYGTYSSATACITTAIFIGSGASALDIRNNIFANSMDNLGTASKSYIIYSNAEKTAYTNINYNDYYPSGAEGVLGFISGADVTTLAAWQNATTGTGQDPNSVSGDPKFTSNTDLHIQVDKVSPVHNAGTLITGITTDFDGDPRGTTPDIGADEYEYIPPSVLDPASFAATKLHSTQIDLSWTPTGDPVNPVMVVYNTSDVFGVPDAARLYTEREEITGGGTVLYLGTNVSYSHTGLTRNTTYYYKAFSYTDLDYQYSPGTTSNATTSYPAVPVALTATPFSGTQIDLGWTKNAAGNDIIVATNSTSTFGDPVNGTTYNAGDPLPTSGTVIYRGSATSFNHTSLTPSTTYYYKAWSVDGGVGYSTTSKTANASTLCNPQALPYTQNFDAVTFPPTCWALENAGSGNNWTRGTSYPYSGAGYLNYTYNYSSAANAWAFTPGFNLTNGKSYRVSFYQRVSYSGTIEKLKLTVGTTPASASQTTTLWDDNNLTSTTYTLRTAEYACTSTGTYYFAFNCYSDANMYSLYVDEVSVTELANMAYVSSTTTQNTNNVLSGSIDQDIIGVQIVTANSLNPLTATSFTFNTNGSTSASDITDAKLWVTAGATFTSPTQLGTTVNNPSGSFNFDLSLSPSTLATGTNYFWLTYSISGSATPYNVVDAECNSFSLSDGSHTPTVVAPTGGRKIVGPLSGTFAIGTGVFNAVTGRNVYPVEMTRTVKVLVPEEESKEQDGLKGEELKGNREARHEQRFIEKDVEEKYTVMYENGQPCIGTLWIDMKDVDKKKFTERTETKKQEVQDAIKAGKTGKSNEKSPVNYETDNPLTYAEVFATVSDAVNALNTRGISGPVTFEFTDASYTGVTAQTINAITNSSATNTVTFKPQAGENVTIVGSTAASLFTVNGADYLIFDGSNNGTNSKNLLIRNENTSYSVISFANGSTYNTFKNITFEGSSTGSNGVVYFSTGANTNNNITECDIRDRSDAAAKPSYGLYFGSTTNDVNSVSKCNIYNFSSYGVYLSASTNTTIDMCNIYMNSASTNSSVYGIYIANANGTNISKNRIYDLNGSSSATIKGIYYYGASGVTVSVNIINNVINLSPSTTGNVDGIDYFAYATNSANIYYNTIYISGSQSSANGTYGVRKRDDCDVFNLSNNVIFNARSNSGETGSHYSVYISSMTYNSLSSNYNDLFVNGTGSVLGYWSSTSCADLASWITASGKDVFSVSGNPTFISSSNLLPDVTNANSWTLNAGAIPIAEVTTDILGNPRKTSITEGANDIGAYEFTPNAASAPVIISGAPSISTPTTVTFAGVTIASITWFTPIESSLPTDITVTYKPGVNPSNTPVGSKFANGIMEITANGGSGYTYDITLKYNLARQGTISSEPNLRFGKYTGSTWTQYPDLPNQTAKTITVSGMTDFSIFTFGDNDNPLPVNLASFTSSLNGRDVKLNWTTSTETNNAGFEIERAAADNDNPVYMKIGYVNGHGTTTAQHTYTFEDKKLNSGKYNYRLKQVDFNGNFEYHNLSGTMEVGLPTKFDLSQNYPNPFNPSTKIDFALPTDSRVNIVLYDITGREVKTLVNDSRKAGYYTVQFNASDLSSGTYFYRIMTKSGTQDFVMTKKMMLVK